MNTKEAIEIVCVGREKLLTVDECHKVVDCLRQGGAYKQIVYEINNERLSDEYSGTYGIPSRSEKGIHQRIKTIIDKNFLTTHI